MSPTNRADTQTVFFLLGPLAGESREIPADARTWVVEYRDRLYTYRPNRTRILGGLVPVWTANGDGEPLPPGPGDESDRHLGVGGELRKAHA